MRYKIAAALLLFLGSAVLVLGGAAFACYAIYANLLTIVDAPAAAAITAAILLFVPVLGVILLALRARRAKRDLLSHLEEAAARYKSPASTDEATLAYLGALARDKPLTAIILSVVFGLSATLLRGKK